MCILEVIVTVLMLILLIITMTVLAFNGSLES